MINRISLLIAGLALSWAPLAADYDLADTSSQEISDETSSQFTLKIFGDVILNSKHRGDEYRGHIDYDHAEVNFTSVIYYNECYNEGLALGLNYEYTFLDWNDNPFFKRKSYDTAVVGITYFTHRLSDWRWLAQGTINFDADKWQFSDYTTYDILLWGRYHYCHNVFLHVGFYAETGLKLDRVWPIFGFEWKFCDDWALNLVYPMNISLVYNYNESWSFAAAARFFNDRHRAGKRGGFYEAVWRYQNTGAEFAINTDWCSWLKSNIHAGYTFGGKLKVANRDDKHSHRFKFKSAPYFGGELTANF